MDYKEKYIKYKKYLDLKLNLYGGSKLRCVDPNANREISVDYSRRNTYVNNEIDELPNDSNDYIEIIGIDHSLSMILKLYPVMEFNKLE